MNAEEFQNSYMPEPYSGCWLWTRGASISGYGAVYPKSQNRQMQAHRFSWIIFRGPIPAGRHVLHRCDTKLCVNPDHLFLGDDYDNHQDRIRKGRYRRTGQNNPRAKLTAEQVDEIRSAIGTQSFIANQFNVSQTNVSLIKRGVTWREG